MVKEGRPRKGSLAYSPRKRARRIVARVRAWPKLLGKPTILGFAGYKAGMTHTIMIDDWPDSPTQGMEISVPVTVVDAPPIKIASIRAYFNTPYGLKLLTEVWAEDLDKSLSRVLSVPKKYDPDAAWKKLEEMKEKISILRVLAHTQPKLSGLGKKTPELFECEVGGGMIEQQLEYCKSIFGKEVDVKNIFKEGELVDVSAITKGKGLQGPVKRWGIKIQSHKTQRSGKGRHVGTLGPQTPAHVRWTVPMAGQLGFQQRTEFNKRILKIGDNGVEVTPKGGFLRYGLLKGRYLLLQGSVPGPTKRLLRFKPATRPPFKVPRTAPEITFISTESKQGK